MTDSGLFCFTKTRLGRIVVQAPPSFITLAKVSLAASLKVSCLKPHTETSSWLQIPSPGPGPRVLAPGLDTQRCP